MNKILIKTVMNERFSLSCCVCVFHLRKKKLHTNKE